MRKPGKYLISNDEYHADKDYLSSSIIKEALPSPAHFKYSILQGNKQHKDKASFEFGTLVHTVLLEPQLIETDYIIYTGEKPDADGKLFNQDGAIRAKEKKQLLEKHPGKTIVSQAWYEFAVKARSNCQVYNEAAKYLFSETGESEPSYYNKCSETGLHLRVRPDRIDLTNKFIVDVKTAQSADREDFKRDVKYNWHYDLSAYMYCLQVFLLTGIECDFYWIVVGKEDLCPIAVYKASLATLEDGKKKFFKSIDNIKTALAMPDEVQYQYKVEEI
jgi:hypothetical protein